MKFRLLEEDVFPESKINITLYNGTDIDYDEVDFSKVNVHDDGYLGNGFYLSADYDYAKSYGGEEKGIVKEFKVNIRNPFSFSDISQTDINNLIDIIVTDYYGNINNCFNFSYYCERLSRDDSLQYVARKIKMGKLSEEDFRYALEIILTNSNHIFYGALYDFSSSLTKYLKSKGHDGCYIDVNGVKYKEVVIYKPEQLKLIR